jgi:hypothetical protein
LRNGRLDILAMVLGVLALRQPVPVPARRRSA